MEYNLKQYSHIGDSVWELFIRENVILHAVSLQKIHKLTTKFVNANFQAEIFEKNIDFLNEEELDLTRRARNIPLSISKRNNQNVHRIATSFEVFIGYLYLNDKKRLDLYFENIKKCLLFE